MTNPVQEGEKTEAIIQAELVRRGFNVLVPFGDNTRYDLVVEEDGRFARLQCKTGWIDNGAIEFKTQSTNVNSTSYKAKGYDGDIEGFVVYNGDVDEIFYVSIDEAATGSMRLRTYEPEQMHSNINWAEDYVFDKRFTLGR